MYYHYHYYWHTCTRTLTPPPPPLSRSNGGLVGDLTANCSTGDIWHWVWSTATNDEFQKVSCLHTVTYCITCLLALFTTNPISTDHFHNREVNFDIPTCIPVIFFSARSIDIHVQIGLKPGSTEIYFTIPKAWGDIIAHNISGPTWHNIFHHSSSKYEW